jgi:STE24 endopeptidase
LNESKAARFQRRRRRAGAVELVSGGVVLSAVALSPLAGTLAAWAERAGRGWPSVSLLLFVGALVLAWALAVLPARLLFGTRSGGRHGALPPEDLLGVEAQAALTALPAALAAALLVRGAVWVAADLWWAVAGVALAAGLAVALRGLPAVLVRLASARPLARPALTARLEDLARRANVTVASIDELPAGASSGPTALVAGVGTARRIFVSAELTEDWTDDEISVVVAHELAHHAHHDLWRAAGLSAVTLTVALWAAEWTLVTAGPALGITERSDLASLPLLALVSGAVWLAATPLRHGQSRRQERRADEFALGLTGGTEAFATAIRRLGQRHLAEEQPSALTRWLFHRHPSVAERLALVDKFRTS